MALPDAGAVGIEVGLVWGAVATLGEKLDGAGMVHPQGPLNDVEVMGAPIAVVAGAN
jgi:hypothetical protein